MLSESQSWPLLVVPAQVPSGDEPELVLCDWQGRQAVVAVVAPHKPDERSVRRSHGGVGPNAAISAFELHDGVVRMRRSGGRKAERQRADCKHKSLHYQPPLLRILPCRPEISLNFYGVFHGGTTAHGTPRRKFSLARPFRNTRLG
jgi:hypothetical protein